MKLSDHSRNRLLHSFDLWDVPQEYSQHVYDYLVNGFDPGGFYTAVLANDFMSAVIRSHPGNQIDALKGLAGWIYNTMPNTAWGSYDRVRTWLKMTDEDRRVVLEQAELIYTTKDEMWLVLKNEHTSNPYEWAVA
jgi:hypothetical protein